ncbi:cytochrome P450 1A5-like [Passer montanus]|uniref:cytochrome P450 1A5-like n=1 Tax=Passer montanus TaxID=9160 RepID=UPI0019608515|nr:cytochrome P450 1A5-like [Passer montanus]
MGADRPPRGSAAPRGRARCARCARVPASLPSAHAVSPHRRALHARSPSVCGDKLGDRLGDRLPAPSVSLCVLVPHMPCHACLRAPSPCRSRPSPHAQPDPHRGAVTHGGDSDTRQGQGLAASPRPPHAAPGTRGLSEGRRQGLGASSQKRFEPYRYLVVSVANVICAMCFGKRYEHEDQELLSLVNSTEEFTDVAAAGNPADFIPVLRYLPSRSMRLFIDFNRYFVSFLQKRVKEHYETYDENNIRDITDSLIEQCLDKKTGTNTATQIPKEKIVNLVNDLFGAGFDTVTTALSWSLMYLVTNPNIQRKIQEELDRTIGWERRPRLSDRGTLPYTEAFILEMFRHSSFLPFTIPHSTTKDTVLNGYFIPKDRCVFVNQWQVNHDEKLWKDPETFNPERFLSADGTKVNKEDGEKVLVFGLGKRRCIGENIARWQVFLFLATLLQQLEFSVCEGGRVDMTPLYGLSLKHKRCEHFQVRQRFPTKGRS